MTNRLELNWSLDGFVSEQRYYCSETPINPENLPAPKAVLAGDVRNYVDEDIEVGKTYYVCIASVKNQVEKLSEIIVLLADKFTQTATFERWSTHALIVLSNSSKTIEFSAGLSTGWRHAGVAAGFTAQSNVARYIEFTIEDWGGARSNNLAFGLSTTKSSSGFAGDGGRMQFFGDGKKRMNGYYSSYSQAFNIGDKIGVMLELKESKVSVTFFKNGVNLGTAFILSANNTLYPIVSFYANSTAQFARISINSDIQANPDGLTPW